jgi:hypothetical protein
MNLKYQFAERIMGSLLLTAKGKTLRQPRSKPTEGKNQKKSKSGAHDPTDSFSGANSHSTKKGSGLEDPETKTPSSLNVEQSALNAENSQPGLPGLDAQSQPSPRPPKPKPQKKDPKSKESDLGKEIPGLERTTNEICQIFVSDFQKINGWLQRKFIKLANAPREAERRRKFEEHHGIYGPIKHTSIYSSSKCY